jgi:predicted amidohydrolase
LGAASLASAAHPAGVERVRFGEIARALALKGAELFLVSSAAGTVDLALQARALDNGCYLVLANRTGEELGYRMCGNSRIVDPYGKIIAEIGREQGIVSAELDTDIVLEARQRRRYLQDFRAEVFLNPGFYR